MLSLSTAPGSSTTPRRRTLGEPQQTFSGRNFYKCTLAEAHYDASVQKETTWGASSNPFQVEMYIYVH